MNEKIQQLMDQSFTDEQGEQFDPERFAKLIVRECAMFSMVITDDHYDVDALYKHFGVEE
jgi:hypothetical protein